MMKTYHFRMLLYMVCVFALGISISAVETLLAQDDSEEPLPASTVRGLQREAPLRFTRQATKEPGILLAADPDAARRSIVEIPATADAYIASERPDENFGSDALFLGYNFFGDRYGAQRILLRFNVDTIPSEARVVTARLRLRLSFASPDDDASMRTVLRRLASAWNESEASWNREPEWAAVRDSEVVGTAPQYYEWEIGDLVQGWVDGSFPNFGIELIGDERVQQRERIFYARETTTDHFPRLVVDYELVEDTSPPAVTVEPLPTFVGRSFIVRWGGEDVGEAGIAYYDIQYRIEGGDWIDWISGVNFTAEEFSAGQNGLSYEFRARGVDRAGNTESFGAAEAFTTVDSGPPSSRVNTLPSVMRADSFTVSWIGSDNGGSGIRYYEVRYRVNEGNWQIWLTQTPDMSAVFTATGDDLYEFEVRAVDNSGRVEPFTGEAEGRTFVDVESPFMAPVLVFPIVLTS